MTTCPRCNKETGEGPDGSSVYCLDCVMDLRHELDAIKGKKLAEAHVKWLLNLVEPLLVSSMAHGFKHGIEYEQERQAGIEYEQER